MKYSQIVTALLVITSFTPLVVRAQERAAPSAVEVATAMEKVLVDVIEQTQASVVAIARVRNDQFADLRDDGFEFRPGRFAQNLEREVSDPTSPDFVPQEYGTGVVIEKGGLILTTYHVLSDPRKNDYYVWTQKRPFKATVIAADPWLDLAVLKIDAQDLIPIKFGDAKDIRKGQFVIALGNPYGIARDGEVSATWGVISNTRRTPPATIKRGPNDGRQSLHHYGNLLQTDARLERGTSGGALVNLQGEMIGLTTSLAPASDVGSTAGFAFPIDQAFKDALEKLKTGRKVEYGFLGVGAGHLSLEERQRGQRGAKVAQVVGASPATEALEREDVITAVGDRPIADSNDLILELSKLAVGTTVDLTIERAGEGVVAKPRVLHRQVTLSKKYMDTPRPVFASVVDPVWRGLTVDYSTAVPNYNGPRLTFVDPEGCVAVTDVERSSTAWKAGLRPGMFIKNVGKTRVATPQEFRDAIGKEVGSVVLRLTEEVGGSNLVTVAP